MRDLDESVLSAAMAHPVGRYHPSNRGDGAPMTVRVPAEMQVRMELAIQAAKEMGLPIKSPSDLMRDALHYFLRALLETHTIDNEQLQALQQLKEVSDYNDYLIKIEAQAAATVKNLSALLTKLMIAKDFSTARKKVRELNHTVRSQSDPYIRSTYERAMESPEYQSALFTLSATGGSILAEEESPRTSEEASDPSERVPRPLRPLGLATRDQPV